MVFVLNNYLYIFELFQCLLAKSEISSDWGCLTEQEILLTVQGVAAADRPEKTLWVHKLWCCPHPLSQFLRHSEAELRYKFVSRFPTAASRHDRLTSDKKFTPSMSYMWTMRAACCLMGVFYFKELLGVSEGIWSVKTSDWQGEKDSTGKLVVQALFFNSSVQQVHPFASGLECVESCGVWGQESIEWKDPSKIKY